MVVWAVHGGDVGEQGGEAVESKFKGRRVMYTSPVVRFAFVTFVTFVYFRLFVDLYIYSICPVSSLLRSSTP